MLGLAPAQVDNKDLPLSICVHVVMTTPCNDGTMVSPLVQTTLLHGNTEILANLLIKHKI